MPRKVWGVGGLVCVALVSGCWQSHMRPESLCAALVPEAVCFDTPRAGVATELEVLVDRGGELCACGQSAECQATTDASGRTLLSHVRCPSSPVCDACEPVAAGRCTLPPLEEGAHPFLGDASGSHRLFDLEVDADAAPARTCVVPAPPSPDGACWDPEPILLLRACSQASAYPIGTRVPIQVESDCGDCRGVGPCTTTLEGHTITVRPTRTSCAASDCVRSCEPTCYYRCTHTCLTPPLEEAEYTLTVEGGDLSLSLYVAGTRTAPATPPDAPFGGCRRVDGR